MSSTKPSFLQSNDPPSDESKPHEDLLNHQGWINTLNSALLFQGGIFFVFLCFWIKNQSWWSRVGCILSLFLFYIKLIILVVFKGLANKAGDQFSDKTYLNLLGYGASALLQGILFVLLGFIVSLVARTNVPIKGYFNTLSLFSKETPNIFTWFITILPVTYFLFSNIWITVLFFALATFIKNPNEWLEPFYSLDLTSAQKLTDPLSRNYSFFIIPVLISILYNSVYSAFTRHDPDLSPGMTLVVKCIQVIILLAVLMLGKTPDGIGLFGFKSVPVMDKTQMKYAVSEIPGNVKHKYWIGVGVIIALALLEMALPDHITRMILPGINYSKSDDAKASMFSGTYNSFILVVSVILATVMYFMK